MKNVSTNQFFDLVFQADRRKAKRAARRGLHVDSGDGCYKMAFVNKHNQLVAGYGYKTSYKNSWHPEIVCR